MPKKKTKWDALDDILKEVWQMLTRGVTHSNDAFHWPVLGTTASNGISLRTVILREFIATDRVLVCHTDNRAEKVREIRQSPDVSWLFYHPERKVQLRISGQATLHTDDQFAEAQWAATKLISRINYCATEAPGTAIAKPSSGLPDFLLKKVPTLLEHQHGRDHFMAIACCIESMDWLRLSTMGNRRARFEWNEEGLRATWLVP
jgi:hypothetical protein